MLIDYVHLAERLAAVLLGRDMVLVGTWMGFEVVASFVAGIGGSTLATGTWTAGSQTGRHWDIAERRNLISTARGRSSSQHGSSGRLITAC